MLGVPDAPMSRIYRFLMMKFLAATSVIAAVRQGTVTYIFLGLVHAS